MSNSKLFECIRVGSIIYITGINGTLEINISEEIEINVTETKEVEEVEEELINETEILEIEIDLEIIGEEPIGETSGIGGVEEVGGIELEFVEDEEVEAGVVEEDKVVEETAEEAEEEIGLTAQVIKGITGFIVNGFRGVTGFAVKEQKTVSIYIQRDFNGTNVSVGEVINLDPVLIRVSDVGDNGTATDVTFVAGQSGVGASFNGTTSSVVISDYNKGLIDKDTLEHIFIYCSLIGY